MDSSATTSPSKDASSSSSPDRKAGFQATINAPVLGVLGFVVCIATWNLARWSGNTAEQRAEAVGPITNPHAQRVVIFARATQDYWNAIIELDKKFLEQNAKLVSELQRRMKTDSQAQVLNYLATAFKNLFETRLKAVACLPMRDVDEALLGHIREELKHGHEAVRAFAGMAEIANALQEWSQRTKSSGKFMSDCLDSFIQGMMGRPFAGYEKAKQESKSFDSEGRQLADSYWRQYQSLLECIHHLEKMDIAELEVRASLSGKYGVEFAPRPDAEIHPRK